MLNRKLRNWFACSVILWQREHIQVHPDPPGAFLGGIVGEAWGLPTVFLGAVVVMLLCGIWVCTQVSTRLVREHELA